MKFEARKKSLVLSASSFISPKVTLPETDPLSQTQQSISNLKNTMLLVENNEDHEIELRVSALKNIRRQTRKPREPTALIAEPKATDIGFDILPSSMIKTQKSMEEKSEALLQRYIERDVFQIAPLFSFSSGISDRGVIDTNRQMSASIDSDFPFDDRHDLISKSQTSEIVQSDLFFSCISDAERHDQRIKKMQELKRQKLTTENDFSDERLQLVKQSYILRKMAERANKLGYKLRHECRIERVRASRLLTVPADTGKIY